MTRGSNKDFLSFPFLNSFSSISYNFDHNPALGKSYGIIEVTIDIRSKGIINNLPDINLPQEP